MTVHRLYNLCMDIIAIVIHERLMKDVLEEIHELYGYEEFEN